MNSCTAYTFGDYTFVDDIRMTTEDAGIGHRKEFPGVKPFIDGVPGF
jgi:hypothetical protein